MQCTQCKKELENNSKYCPYCGTKVERTMIAESLGKVSNVRDDSKKAVGLASIKTYEGIIDIIVVLYAIIGFLIGMFPYFATGNENAGIFSIIGIVCGGLIGYVNVLPVKVMLVTSRNVHTVTDSVAAIEQQMKGLEKRNLQEKE